MNSKKDFYILFITRSLRLFSYGSLSVVLFLYLAQLKFSEIQIGQLLTYILLGDLIITMWLTTSADRIGRKKTLAIGALLKLFTGYMFAVSENYYILILSGIVGVISTSGGEIGPFIAIEQAALTELKENISDGEIASLFGWYNLFGYMSQALGAMFTGLLTHYLMTYLGWNKLETYRITMFTYAFWGLAKFILYTFLSDKIEAKSKQRQIEIKNISGEKQKEQKTIIFGVKRKKTLFVLVQLSLLFALDSFAGGFVMQTFLSYWFQKSWSFDMSSLGGILMFVNIISGVSGLYASTMVSKIGAMQTMIVTHLPSHIFLMLIPLMPNSTLAIAMLFCRFCISTMDVPARQAYVATVVDSDERSAAGGITNVARSLGLSIAPLLLGKIISTDATGTTQPNAPISSLPFFIAGALKSAYDLILTFCYVYKKSGKTEESKEVMDKIEVVPERMRLTESEDSTQLINEIENALKDETEVEE